MTSWAQRLFTVAGIGAMLLSTRCASEKPDGEDCEADGDCTSTKCRNGTCEGADCACEGADCRGQSSCQAGWLCARPTSKLEEIIPICRKQCAGPGSCQAGKHCENGLCRDGGEPFSIAWVTIPRTSPCSARVPCKYEVKPGAGVTVVKYAWKFGETAVDTTTPDTTFTYPSNGSFQVSVEATANDGATARLTATEVLCIPQNGACDPGGTGARCCAGTCTIDGICEVK